MVLLGYQSEFVIKKNKKIIKKIKINENIPQVLVIVTDLSNGYKGLVNRQLKHGVRVF